jgi:arsenate reductase (thioredoxin)
MYKQFSFSNNRSKTKTKKTILFVCVENAGRSQIAEGFFRKYAPDGYEPISAGIKPTSRINPLAMRVMDEVGIDISQQKPKDITEDMMRNSDKIVNMGCMDENFCPTVFISQNN